jgi:hypothetical protein
MMMAVIGTNAGVTRESKAGEAPLSAGPATLDMINEGTITGVARHMVRISPTGPRRMATAYTARVLRSSGIAERVTLTTVEPQYATPVATTIILSVKVKAVRPGSAEQAVTDAFRSQFRLTCAAHSSVSRSFYGTPRSLSD